MLSTKDDCVGARERQYSSARPAALGPEWVRVVSAFVWYLWLSAGLERPLRFRVCRVLSVCRAPTLGTSLATLFSLANPFAGPALDTLFARFPFFRAVMVMSSLGCPIWRTPRTMNVLAYAASSGEPFPYLFVCPQPAQSRRSPSLTRSQLGVSPIASQRLLPEPPRCLLCFLVLCSSCSHRTSQKPAKPMARHHHNDHPANLR